MAEPRQWRWYGDPDEEVQPDVGDVLAYPSEKGDWFHLVHTARRVRGGQPHDLVLTVTRHDLVDGYGIPQEICEAINSGATYFRAFVRRRTC